MANQGGKYRTNRQNTAKAVLIVFALAAIFSGMWWLTTTEADAGLGVKAEKTIAAHRGLTASSPPESCRSCHHDIYEQWKKSFHAKSTTSPAFRGMATLFNFSVGPKYARECLNCHATDVKLSGDYNARWQAILTDKPNTRGVTCTACHAIRDVDKDNYNPLIPVKMRAVRMPFHNVERSPLFKKGVMCSSCHDYNNSHAVRGDWERGVPCCTTNRDFRKTKMAKKGVQCQTCHMAPGLDKNPKAWKKALDAVTGFKERLMNLVGLSRYVENKPMPSHLFPGSHDPNLLKSAVDAHLDVKVMNEGKVALQVNLKNLTGHSIPNGCPPRTRMFLRLWLEDADGFEIDSHQVEYGLNFKDKNGFEPAMVDAAVARGFVHVLEAEKTGVVKSVFDIPHDGTPVTAKASLTYVYFVMPPSEAQNRMQQGLIRRIRAGSQKEKDFILNIEIPGRMAAMNRLASAYPPVVMWHAERTLTGKK